MNKFKILTKIIVILSTACLYATANAMNYPTNINFYPTANNKNSYLKYFPKGTEEKIVGDREAERLLLDLCNSVDKSLMYKIKSANIKDILKSIRNYKNFLKKIDIDLQQREFIIFLQNRLQALNDKIITYINKMENLFKSEDYNEDAISSFMINLHNDVNGEEIEELEKLLNNEETTNCLGIHTIKNSISRYKTAILEFYKKLPFYFSNMKNSENAEKKVNQLNIHKEYIEKNFRNIVNTIKEKIKPFTIQTEKTNENIDKKYSPNNMSDMSEYINPNCFPEEMLKKINSDEKIKDLFYKTIYQPWSPDNQINTNNKSMYFMHIINALKAYKKFLENINIPFEQNKFANYFERVFVDMAKPILKYLTEVTDIANKLEEIANKDKISSQDEEILAENIINIDNITFFDNQEKINELNNILEKDINNNSESMTNLKEHVNVYKNTLNTIHNYLKKIYTKINDKILNSSINRCIDDLEKKFPNLNNSENINSNINNYSFFKDDKKEKNDLSSMIGKKRNMEKAKEKNNKQYSNKQPVFYITNKNETDKPKEEEEEEERKKENEIKQAMDKIIQIKKYLEEIINNKENKAIRENILKAVQNIYGEATGSEISKKCEEFFKNSNFSTIMEINNAFCKYREYTNLVGENIVKPFNNIKILKDANYQNNIIASYPKYMESKDQIETFIKNYVLENENNFDFNEKINKIGEKLEEIKKGFFPSSTIQAEKNDVNKNMDIDKDEKDEQEIEEIIKCLDKYKDTPTEWHKNNEWINFRNELSTIFTEIIKPSYDEKKGIYNPETLSKILSTFYPENEQAGYMKEVLEKISNYHNIFSKYENNIDKIRDNFNKLKKFDQKKLKDKDLQVLLERIEEMLESKKYNISDYMTQKDLIFNIFSELSGKKLSKLQENNTINKEQNIPKLTTIKEDPFKNNRYEFDHHLFHPIERMFLEINSYNNENNSDDEKIKQEAIKENIEIEEDIDIDKDKEVKKDKDEEVKKDKDKEVKKDKEIKEDKKKNNNEK